ncbi:MAG: hypothetical protein U0800_10370 [Isosphaeraceae bacterium]
MGACSALKAGVDISTLNPQSKIVAQAMKTYGMILADNGSNFFFSGQREALPWSTPPTSSRRPGTTTTSRTRRTGSRARISAISRSLISSRS